jgi:hypothetical protein
MAAVLIFILVVGLLVFLGIFISLQLYNPNTRGTGRFTRIRRVRTLRPASGGPVIEETVEEEIDAGEPPAEEP